jgi:hypothetical protein
MMYDYESRRSIRSLCFFAMTDNGVSGSSKLDHAVILLNFIREVPGSYIGRDTDYIDISSSGI